MGHTNDISEFWASLFSGRDPITEVPLERWDVDQFYDEDRTAPGKIYVRNGAFIPGVEDFDFSFFGIAEVEARGMDAHQRLLTEVSFESFHNAGHAKEALNGVECGVFFGCCTLSGMTVDAEDIGPFTNIGSAQSGLSGRISHALGLRGRPFATTSSPLLSILILDHRESNYEYFDRNQRVLLESHSQEQIQSA